MWSQLPHTLALSVLFLLRLGSAQTSTSDVDDSSSQLVYYPAGDPYSWSSQSGQPTSEFMNGTLHTSWSGGSGVTLPNWNGVGVEFYATTNFDHSTVTVILDGQGSTFNGYSPSFTTLVSAFSATGLNQSVPHTITIINAQDVNHAMDVDSFVLTTDSSSPMPASNYGTFAAPGGACSKNMSIDDTSPLVSFWPQGGSPSWLLGGNDSYANSTVHSAAVDGASASLRFNGSGVYFVGTRNADHGSFIAVLDGVISPVAGSFWTSLQTQQVLWNKTGLEETFEHLLTLVMIGSGIAGVQHTLDVDAFLVTQTVDCNSLR